MGKHRKSLHNASFFQRNIYALPVQNQIISYKLFKHQTDDLSTELMV